ncbi:TOBE domain-containing protein [Janibacter hoylei]|uniref:TOBE domain-containing protein n=1 Tax=Janibacter hoylei TaxID=364298 RepID=UPI00389AC192
MRLHTLRPDAAGSDVRATVTDVSFTGVATQYLVTVPSGGTWSVYEQNLDVEPQATRPGDEVWLSWNPAHAFVVSADDLPEGAEDKAFVATAGEGA